MLPEHRGAGQRRDLCSGRPPESQLLVIASAEVAATVPQVASAERLALPLITSERAAPLFTNGSSTWTLNAVAHSLPAKGRPTGLPARSGSTPCFNPTLRLAREAPASRSSPALAPRGTPTHWARP